MLSRLWIPDVQRAPRGGFRQRAVAAPIEAQDATISQLASRQLLLWATGTLSATQLVDTMRDAVSDGLQHTMVIRMSQVPRDNHAHEGMMALIRRRTAVLDDIRIIDVSDDGAPSHILLPSVMFRTLHRWCPQQFVRRLGADSGRLAEFWKRLYSGPNMRWVNHILSCKR